jgi:exodeoxyribonuclease I
MSFVFYDTETTGTNTAFDQILQFGAIKTDDALKEIARFEIRCQLLPYVVPSPGAMRVTGVTAEQLVDPSLPTHYQMMRAIRAKLMEWSPAIFIGHNSLGFDEHLLRQALYKTLHGPYLTNTNGNCRTDSLRMIQAVARFAPEALEIPVDDRGKQIFKLDRLAPANGFDHSAAHDAMADVEATIHMCRLIAERVPNYWSGFVRFAQKSAVTDFALETDLFVLTDFYYTRPYSWMVTAIGTNPQNGSEMLVFDLSRDPDDLASLGDEDLVTCLAKSPKPVRAMRTNSGPIVLPYEDCPEDLRSALPPLAELRRRAARIKSDSNLCQRLTAARLKSQAPREPSVHVEEQIYDGFASKSDTALMERFHALDWQQRLPLIGQFGDERLRALGQRLVYSEARDLMHQTTLHQYEAAIARRLMVSDGTTPWLTYPKAIADVEDFLAIAQGSDAALLSGHRDFLRERAEQAAGLLA